MVGVRVLELRKVILVASAKVLSNVPQVAHGVCLCPYGCICSVQIYIRTTLCVSQGLSNEDVAQTKRTVLSQYLRKREVSEAKFFNPSTSEPQQTEGGGGYN